MRNRLPAWEFWLGYFGSGVLGALATRINGGNFVAMTLGGAGGGMVWIAVVSLAAHQHDKRRRNQ